MAITPQQLLQQGVLAHKSGNIKDAERIYREVLQTLPMHPDANHNLGIINASMGNLSTALSLLKRALDVNPQVEHFWVSYITTLLKKQKFKTAKQFINKAKQSGFYGDKFTVLEEQAKHPNPKGNFSQEPSKSEIDKLLTYYRSNHLIQAQKLALSMTKQYPNYALGWQVLGVVLEQFNQLDNALIAHEKAAQLKPNDAYSHSNLGNVLRILSRLKEAERSCKKAIELNPNLAEAYNNLGNTQKELNQSDDAKASYYKAIKLKPEYAQAYNNLGVLLHSQGNLVEAEDILRKTISLKPDYATAHQNLGSLLQERGKLIEAEASFNRAIAIQPDLTEAIYYLGVLLHECGKYEKAVEQFASIKFKESQSYLIRCFFRLDKQKEFYEILDNAVNKGVSNAIIGSLISRSEIKYGVKRDNPFCQNPLAYVLQTNLSKQYDFEGVFLNPALEVLNNQKVHHRSQGLLVNGIQTSGNIFTQSNAKTAKIEQIIKLEIEKYRLNFTSSEEGLITNWPKDYRLFGWLVSMKSGGQLKAHMHENGWLSGSIYINVPEKSDKDSGNLVVCLNEESEETKSPNEMKSIDVVTGSLCLFPASLLHYTIPFDAKDDRIVLAFDVIPSV